MIGAIAAGAIVAGALAVVSAAPVHAVPAPAPARVAPAAAPLSMTAYTTFYGYPDNDPPNSVAIAFPRRDGHPTLHDAADGRGTYKNPVTFAAGRPFRAKYRLGTRVYVPSLRKYFMLEDMCESCDSGSWLDLWIDGRGYGKAAVLRQEERLTRNRKVIINPKPGHPVRTTPLMKYPPGS